MLSTKPYLVRAFYEWILDNEMTPYVVINATLPRCNVPEEFIENGEIVFNVSPNAVRELKIGNEFMEFHASFSGVIRIISVPVKAINAIYAEENGQGMFFDQEEDEVVSQVAEWSETVSTTQDVVQKSDKKSSHLRLVD